MARQVVNLICIATFTVHVVFPKEPVKPGTSMRGLAVSVPRCFVPGSTPSALVNALLLTPRSVLRPWCLCHSSNAKKIAHCCAALSLVQAQTMDWQGEASLSFSAEELAAKTALVKQQIAQAMAFDLLADEPFPPLDDFKEDSQYFEQHPCFLSGQMLSVVAIPS